jgi:hypothetical protein
MRGPGRRRSACGDPREHPDPATCGHPCCQKIAALMTGLKVHRPLDNFRSMCERTLGHGRPIRACRRRRPLESRRRTEFQHLFRSSIEDRRAGRVLACVADQDAAGDKRRERRSQEGRCLPDIVDRAGAAQGTDLISASR